MNFNSHFDLAGKHAFLGASQHSWVNYTPEKLKDRWYNEKAKIEGTELHDIARRCIEHKIKLQATHKTLNMYVNDAIGFGMIPEQILYYSEFAFGTADTIKYFEKQRFLRVHDLKTGSSPVSMKQLEIYNALFFLEYGDRLGITPMDVGIENRIYQNNDIQISNPDPVCIREIMDKIVQFDLILREERSKG